MLDDRVPGGPAESHAEFIVGEALAAVGIRGLVRQHRLAVPGVGRFRFDLAVPDLRWAIEVDAFPPHRETAGHRADLRRDAAVASMGWSTTRLGPRDLGVALDGTVQHLRAEFHRRRQQALPGA